MAKSRPPVRSGVCSLFTPPVAGKTGSPPSTSDKSWGMAWQQVHALVVAAERMHAGREGGGERGSGHALSEPKVGDVNRPETSHRQQSYLLERPRFT